MSDDDVVRLKREIEETKKKLQQLELQLQVFQKLDDNKNCFSLNPDKQCDNCICWKMVRSYCS